MSSAVRKPDGLREVDALEERIASLERQLAGETERRIMTLEAGVADWDSGWVADSLAAGNGIRTFTHNLELVDPPLKWQLWFSSNKLNMFPVGEGMGMGTNEMAASTAAQYHNPSYVCLFLNTVEMAVYVSNGTIGLPLWSAYNGGAWLNYNAGFWRMRIWK